MTFGAPLLAAGVGLLAVPALLLLYFLKLRRRFVAIPSTLLWTQAYEDVQANEPFQKLRPSILLFLQLLGLLALLFALAQPMIEAPGSPAARTIIIVDQSASMNALDAQSDQGEAITRLDRALERARELIDARGDAEMLIIAAGSRARALCGFESRGLVLDAALNSIEATDEVSDLGAAIELAGTLAITDESSDGRETVDVILLSDGVAPPAQHREGFRMRAGSLRYVQVGPPRDTPVANVGVTTMNARRDFREPSRIVVFARFANAATEPVDIRATLVLDGDDIASVPVALPAASENGPGESAVTFEAESAGAAVLLVRHDRADAMPADDAAGLVMSAPQAPRILVLTDGDQPDPFLLDLLDGMEPGRLLVRPLGQFTDMASVAGSWDLVVFDRVSPETLPPVASLSFGAAPPPAEIVAPEQLQGRRVETWLRQDPLLRHVALDQLVYRGGSLRLPTGARPLALGAEGPILAAFEVDGIPHVAASFALRESNWPAQVGVVVFLQNVLEAALRRSAPEATTLRPGEPIRVTAVDPEVRLDLPGTAPVPATPGRAVTLPPVPRAGLVRIDGARQPFVTPSVLSSAETDIRPRASVVVNARDRAAADTVGTTRRPIGAWFLLGALGMLVIEWFWWMRSAR